MSKSKETRSSVKKNSSINRKVSKKVTGIVKKDLRDQVDYGSDNDEQSVRELDDIPELYESNPETILKERYIYKPEVRKEIIYVTPENSITSEIMTRYEYTEIISIRAKQIEDGGPCFTSIENLTDPIDMAEKEMRDRMCPLDITRMLSEYVGELWHANEMGFTEE
jgi:DNA-directed RNA polymerase I, II, and III subunit RPABC2